MKHVFIVNPVAGRHNPEEAVRKAAEAYFPANGGEYKIRVTQAPGHASSIAAEESASGEPVRLYSCGGDGTLNEVAAGAMPYPNAQVACIPTGSGNDYIRNFGTRDDFLDLPSQAEGVPLSVDMIRCGARTAVNICSCGYDATVAFNLEKFKKLPFIEGHVAYILSCLYTLVKSNRNPFEILVDGKTGFKEDYLLAAFCNGCWYGGGFKVAPRAALSHGKLDFVLIKTLPRLRFLKGVGKFRTGDQSDFRDLITYIQGTSVAVKSAFPVPVNLDGEIVYAQSMEFSVIPNALSFVLPVRLSARREGAASPESSSAAAAGFR